MPSVASLAEPRAMYPPTPSTPSRRAQGRPLSSVVLILLAALFVPADGLETTVLCPLALRLPNYEGFALFSCCMTYMLLLLQRTAAFLFRKFLERI